jgi:outer membrane receptor protein involved in Fe transport
VEWSGYARVTPWFTLDGDLALSRARFRDENPTGNYIPGALDRVISAGATVEPRQPIFGSIRVRHFGPRPLIENASVKSRSTTIWNGEAGYRFSNRVRLVLEVFNMFGADVSDVDYFYASRLPGDPVAGIEDVHTHPALPRSMRLGLQLSF